MCCLSFYFSPCVRCARVADNRKHLHQHNVERVLVDLLTSEGEDACVKTATCKAVHAMSFHESSKDTLRELGMETFVTLQIAKSFRH